MATQTTAAKTKGRPVRVHHTDTVDREWDGPEAESKLRDDAGEREFRKLFAWLDADSPESKTAQKFPHHEVTARGAVGAANVRAAINGVSILNGGRGGADIPKSHREGVYAHLAAHLRDAGEEPPDLER
jgi:hypothetical protein